MRWEIGGIAPDPAGLLVRGGPGGTSVGVDSLERAAVDLARVARDGAPLAWRAGAAAVDVDVVTGAVLSRATGVAAMAGLSDVGVELTAELAALLELAVAVRAAGAAYRAGEAAVARAVEGLQDRIMAVGGLLAPDLLVGCLALHSLGVDVPGLVDRVAFDHPQVADLAGGAEGLVLGLRADPLTAPLLPAASPDHDPDDLDDDDLGDDAFGDLDYEDAVEALAESAARWGLLDDRGRAQVTPEPAARPGARALHSLRDLVADQANIGDGEDYAGHVRVIEVAQSSGSVWIVEVSGTQEWDPRAGDNPFDLTTDLRSMAQQSTVLADGVQQALAQAQAEARVSDGSPAGVAAPVLLVGHSLGGIAAAGLASSPRFTARHRVTHVVTIGAPVARMPVPRGIAVLSLEHTRDPVPRLDGVPNPDRASWVTVTRDAHADGEDRASRVHDLGGYVETAALVDDSTDPSVAAWRSSSAAFFEGDRHGAAVIRDYAVRRVRP